MPRQLAVSVDNNFTKGLITEASGLNFPENACTDTFNCRFDLTGAVERRPGVDYELNFTGKAISRNASAIISFLWRNPNGDPSKNLIVLQVGPTIYFWDAGDGTQPLSAGAILNTINLNSFTPAGGTPPDNNECQFTIGNGKLYVTHPYTESFVVTYSSAGGGTFTTRQINPMIRDFEGVDDSLAVDTRPTSTLAGLTAQHLYNLQNQGWTTTNLTTWDTNRSDMPSNVDVMWAFKNSSNAFDTSTVPNVVAGNSPAPKGHYILSVYNQDRATVSGIGGITPVTSGTNRASTCAFFAGRLFIAGINSVGYNSKIYFTQILEKDAQLDYFYQTNDPTSEDSFDLLPSDGGVISIPDAGTIIKMVVVQTGIAVFATNGLWYITGSQGLGFVATDYSVVRVSAIPAVTASSFVDVEGYPLWWNNEGIYALKPGQTSAIGLDVSSLTHTTIATFFTNLPIATKRNCKGYYNRLTKIVQWLYTSEEVADVDSQYDFDSILNFDTILGAFYPWSFTNTNTKINGLVVIEGSTGFTITDQVIDSSSNTVQDTSGNNVVVYELGNTVTAPREHYIISYLDSGVTKFTFGEARGIDFKDWITSSTPEDYESYFVSGYRIRGNALMDFQSNYVMFYGTYDSAYTVSGQWDYANNVNSGRWSYPQTVSATVSSLMDLTPKRLKIRGRGKALQIRVTSVDGSPFNIKGWSMYASANQTP